MLVKLVYLLIIVVRHSSSYPFYGLDDDEDALRWLSGRDDTMCVYFVENLRIRHVIYSCALITFPIMTSVVIIVLLCLLLGC